MRLSNLMLRLRALFWKDQVEREMEDELRFHLEMRIAENLRRGMEQEDARCAALHTFGNVEQAKEECRDARGTRWIEVLWQESCYACRTLLKERIFTAACVITIGLGLGALTSVFSVFHSALMQPLPYEGRNRLAAIIDPEGNIPYAVSFPCYEKLRERNRMLAGIGLYTSGGAELKIGESVQQVSAAFVTASVFQVLKTQPVRGRIFVPEEDRAGGPKLVLISASFWRDRLGGEGDVLGKQVVINGRPRTIIGVLPSSFEFPLVPVAYKTIATNVEVWAPLQVEYASQLHNPGARFMRLVASVPPGTSIARAEEDFRASFKQLVKEHPEFNMRALPNLTYYRDYVVGDYRQAFMILLIAGFFVMAIACANAMNLFLIRSEKKRRERAVRLVLGAGMSRLLAQSMAEALCVSSAGCMVGIMLAWWSLDSMRVLARERIPRLSEASIGTAGFGFIAAAALLAMVVIGALPHLKPRAASLMGALNASRNVSGQSGRRMRGMLVILEFALAMVLMIGAGLMIRSIQNLLNIGLGFNPRNVLTFFPTLPASLYQTAAQREEYCALLEQRLAALPGVLSAGRTSLPPLWEGYVAPQSLVRTEEDENTKLVRRTGSYAVSLGYFKAMGIPILRGRGFAATDSTQNNQQGVIIDESLANSFWPGQEAIGRKLFVAPTRTGGMNDSGRPGGESQNICLTVIGIVPSIKKYGVKSSAPMGAAGEVVGEIYRPTGSYNGALSLTAGFFALKTQGDPFKLADTVRREAAEVNRAVGISQFTSMENRWRDISAETRFYTVILNIFGLSALLLAAVGIYGVVAYSMAQRTHEFGVRMALGAGRFQIMRLASIEGIRWILIGAAAGLVGGLFLCRFLKSMLFEVGGPEVLTLFGVVAILALVAFIACYLPARRAAKLDPWMVLRVD